MVASVPVPTFLQAVRGECAAKGDNLALMDSAKETLSARGFLGVESMQTNRSNDHKRRLNALDPVAPVERSIVVYAPTVKSFTIKHLTEGRPDLPTDVYNGQWKSSQKQGTGCLTYWNGNC